MHSMMEVGSMRKASFSAVGLVVFLLLPAAHSQTAQSLGPKAARIEFAKEFIRELEALYGLQETAKKEFAEDKSPNGQLATAIRAGTRTLFEMNKNAGILDRILLDSRYDKIRTTLIEINAERASLVQEIVDVAKKLSRAPEAGVDYGALNARAPELTAQVEQLDKMIFNLSQAVFLSLVDLGRTDKDGNASHLIITTKERDEIIKGIDASFPSTLENKNPTGIVSAVWVIKYGLSQSRYKSADDTNN